MKPCEQLINAFNCVGDPLGNKKLAWHALPNLGYLGIWPMSLHLVSLLDVMFPLLSKADIYIVGGGDQSYYGASGQKCELGRRKRTEGGKK